MTTPTLVGPVLDDIIDNLTIVEMEQHLDDDVPCAIGHRSGSCPLIAELVLTCPTCGHNWTACTPHRNTADRSDYEGITCRATVDGPGPGCGAPIWRPWNWRPL